MMLTETKKAIASVLNAYTRSPHLSDELDALSVCAIAEGVVNRHTSGGYTVPETVAPVAPDLRTETLGRIVAVFKAFENRDDKSFNKRLTELEDYLVDHDWISITLDDGYVAIVPSAPPVLPLDAFTLITHVLNASDTHSYLTLHDGLVRLAGYLVDTELIGHSKDTGYSVPDTESPELQIIPFVPKATNNTAR